MRSGRRRSAAGKGAESGTSVKSRSRAKKIVASDADNAPPTVAADPPPTGEAPAPPGPAGQLPPLQADEAPPLPAAAAFPPEQPEDGHSAIPEQPEAGHAAIPEQPEAGFAAIPEQPEAGFAAGSTPRRKTRAAGRAERATAKESTPPADSGASASTPTAAEEPLLAPVIAETTSGEAVPSPATAELSDPPPAVAGTVLPDLSSAAMPAEAGASALSYPGAYPYDATSFTVGSVDAAPFADGPSEVDLLIDEPDDAAPFADDLSDAGLPFDYLIDTGRSVDDLFDVFAAPSDEESRDDVEQSSETAGEIGRKRRRSRRGGRGRRKNNRAASAVNGEEAGPGETPAAAIGADAVTADVPFSEAPADAQAGAETDAEYAPDVADAPQTAGAKGKVRRKMLVSVLPGEQVEVVITEEGQVQEYYVEMLHQAKTKGNIYKGVVHNIDPNLQAAFVGYGAARNGFLQIDEIHPEYYVSPHDGSRGRKYPLIQKILKPGQEVLVQVVKEPAGSKGAFLTTYLSIPGRFLVLTPGREQVGVSRKVEDNSERARLRELLEGLTPGPGLGVIVRTVSMGAGKTNLQRDLQFLKRTWKEVRARGTSETPPSMIYQEMDLTARAVRDYLNESIEEVRIDDEQTAAAVTEVAEALFPRRKNLVRVYKDPGMSLFERFNVQRQLDQIHSREVTLPSGGRLVIDATEALTAIDINSGRSGGKNNFEDLAYRTNMEAAAMIPLQLRLRDIGGQVVADFIEMRDRNHWREVEKTLRNGMKADRARYDVGKVSAFGLLEMVRQRLGSSAISVSTEPCPYCNGAGVRRNMEWRCQRALRDIRNLMRAAQSKSAGTAEYHAEPELALHLLNHKRKLLTDLEQLYGVGLAITVRASETGG
jgi:ribonuclease E